MRLHVSFLTFAVGLMLMQATPLAWAFEPEEAQAIADLSSEQPARKQEALLRLKRYPTPENQRRIARFLSDSSDEIRLAAIRALSETQDPDIQRQIAKVSYLTDFFLAVRLTDLRPNIQLEGIKALTRAQDPDIQKKIAENFLSTHGRDAVRALSGTYLPEIENKLVKLLTHASPNVRTSAARALARTQNPEILRQLRRNLMDIRAETQRVAVIFFQDSQDIEVQRKILRLLTQSNSDLRVEAAKALAGTMHEEIRQQLETLMSADKSIDETVNQHLRHRQALLEGLAAPQVQSRVSSIQELQETADPAVLSRLAQLLLDPDARVRAAAGRALMGTRDEDVLQVLRHLTSTSAYRNTASPHQQEAALVLKRIEAGIAASSSCSPGVLGRTVEYLRNAIPRAGS